MKMFHFTKYMEVWLVLKIRKLKLLIIKEAIVIDNKNVFFFLTSATKYSS